MKRLAWHFPATLLIVAVLLHFIWWIAAGAAIIAAIVGLRWFLVNVCHRQDAAIAREAQHRAGLRAGADRQHQWVIRGDERGTYGQYPPAAVIIPRRFSDPATAGGDQANST
jgi:hypothetical protein